MSFVGRVFPVIYSVSFYNFAVKSIAVLIYAVILSIIFGFLISDSEPQKSFPQSSTIDTNSSSAESLLASVRDNSTNEILVSQADLDEIVKGPENAVQVINEKTENVNLNHDIPDLIFEE